MFVIFATGTAIKVLLRQIPGCRNLPENKVVNGRMLPSRALAVEDYSGRGLRWVAFAFESVRLWTGPLAPIDVEIVVVVSSGFQPRWNCIHIPLRTTNAVVWQGFR